MHGLLSPLRFIRQQKETPQLARQKENLSFIHVHENVAASLKKLNTCAHRGVRQHVSLAFYRGQLFNNHPNLD